MAYGMLVAAVVTSIVVTGLCFSIGWRKVYIVAPLQFVAALAVTSLYGPLTVRDVYEDDAFWMALVISTAMPLLFLVLRVIVGRLDKRDEADRGEQHRPPSSQRGLHW